MEVGTLLAVQPMKFGAEREMMVADEIVPWDLGLVCLKIL